MADTYKLISIICMIIALVLLIVAVIMFFTLNIRKVIGDLSGKTAKKYVKDMQKKSKEAVESLNYAKMANENIQVKNIGTDNTNINENSRIKNYTARADIASNNNTTNNHDEVTGRLSVPNVNQIEEATSVLGAAAMSDEVTTVLDVNATTVLDMNATTVLEPNVTTVLDMNATTVLEPNVTTVLDNASLKINGFEIYLDIVVKHTNETI